MQLGEGRWRIGIRRWRSVRGVAVSEEAVREHIGHIDIDTSGVLYLIGPGKRTITFSSEGGVTRDPALVRAYGIGEWIWVEPSKKARDEI